MIQPAWSTAVHESGHAVIGRVLRLPCGMATVVLNEDEQITGVSITHDQWAIAEHWEEIGIFHRKMNTVWRARMMTFMAGAEAEKVLIGSCCGGDGDDQYQVALMAEEWVRDAEDWERWHERLRRQTARLVRWHREAIERVAKALIERHTLMPHEIDALTYR
jgi:ATP-dependent Zn protease